MEGCNFVKVSLFDYVDLVSKEEELDNLLDCIFEDATLTYDEKKLAYSDRKDRLMNYLQIVEKQKYEKRLNELKSSEAEE